MSASHQWNWLIRETLDNGMNALAFFKHGVVTRIQDFAENTPAIRERVRFIQETLGYQNNIIQELENGFHNPSEKEKILCLTTVDRLLNELIEETTIFNNILIQDQEKNFTWKQLNLLHLLQIHTTEELVELKDLQFFIQENCRRIKTANYGISKVKNDTN